MSVKSLKAKDRFGRVYCLFLSLSNSYLIESLCTNKKEKIKRTCCSIIVQGIFERILWCYPRDIIISFVAKEGQIFEI